MDICKLIDSVTHLFRITDETKSLYNPNPAMYRPMPNTRLCSCPVSFCDDSFMGTCETKAEAQCDLNTECASTGTPDSSQYDKCWQVINRRKKRDLNNVTRDDYIKSITRRPFPQRQVQPQVRVFKQFQYCFVLFILVKLHKITISM